MNTRRGLQGRCWFLLVTLAASLSAQVPFTGSYLQNFDALLNSGSISYGATVGPVFDVTGLPGWAVSKYAGNGTTNFALQAGTGSGNAGAAYSFGAAASSERALGSLASGTVVPRFGVRLTNNTGETITLLNVTYTGEQWRSSTSQLNTLTFAYSTDAASINAGTFTAAAALDFTQPTAALVTNGPINGNDSVNRSVISGSLAIAGGWAPGQVLTLRWSDVDNSGNDAGLAIDDLSIGADTPPPALESSSPAAGDANVDLNASIGVTFNQPVTVTDGWFLVVGSISGVHSATDLGAGDAYTIDPTLPFAEGETITVTLVAANIRNAENETPAANETFSFTTAIVTPVAINRVQGTGTTSPYANVTLPVEGVVTAVFPGLGGYYLQTPAGDPRDDANPETSEGIFVFNNTPVTVGTLLRVTGKVVEFGGGGSTQTELSNVLSVVPLGVGLLPPAVEVSLPFASVTAAERFEGMRVVLPQTLTVSDNQTLGQFGEFALSLGRPPSPTNVAEPGLPALAQEVLNGLNFIVVDDGVTPSYPTPTPYLADSAGEGSTRRAGSTVTSLAGILDEKFGSYIIEPTEPVVFVDANPRGNPPAVGGALRVVIGNVLNYFNGNGTNQAGAAGGFPTSRGANTLAEFERQRAKIIAGILRLTPDIMGLTEIENDGFGPASAIVDLVNGLNDAAPAGETYAFIDASGENLGTDAIANALIYRVDRVAPVGAPQTLSHVVFVQARPPLAQTFRHLSSNEVLTVCINHFKSKGSASPDTQTPNRNLDQGDGQGASNYIRTRQAEELMAWLATDPTASGDPDVLVIGDLNAYAKEDPIRLITTVNAFNPTAYVNLTEHFEGIGGYSYSFDGAVGHLDHALASPALAGQVVNAQTWHANADEPVYLDYNLENKSATNVPVNAGTAFRYSDHDPVVVGVTLDRTAPVIVSLTPSSRELWPANHQMVAVTLTPEVFDAVDSAPTVRIVAVTSNEAANGKGDGNTELDWEITGPLTLNLRAERSGKGGDRVYTITVEAVDASGNFSMKTVTVTVPHNK